MEPSAPAQPLLIVGASTRAAAFSALRAGLQPSCIDLFADADLSARCPVVRIPGAEYPDGIAERAAAMPDGPWMYTGALENRPALIDVVSKARLLWGNSAATLQRVRDPAFLAGLLQTHGLPCPALHALDREPPKTGRWLLKPRAGAAGVGIRRWQPGQSLPRRTSLHYLQAFVEGGVFSAVFVARRGKAELLGVTRQLLGVPWLFAAEFHYCGSLSVDPAPALRQDLQRLGQVLTEACDLRGLFGVDFILHEERPWLVEVNPRYTASVEVVEESAGVPALAWHRSAFDAAYTPPLPMASGNVVGKAILFTDRDVTFPGDGPWRRELSEPRRAFPDFADIPCPGEAIPAGRPVCTLLARAASADACLGALRDSAERLTRLLRRE